jgi:hypothetical protein
MNGQKSFPSSTLTESERLQRVAAILCNAILLGEAGEALRMPSEEIAPEASPVVVKSDHPDDERILRYLDLVKVAPPGEIRGTLGLSRSSACRALQRLARTRRITGSGQTRQLVYQLNAGEPPAERIGLN